MTVQCFLDTNILLYAAMRRKNDAAKQDIARNIIGTQNFALSVQVLQEFYVNVTRKGNPPMSAVSALEWIELLEIQPCMATTTNLVKCAIENSERYQISYWDGAIVAAAQEMGAAILYSEDLNNQQHYGSVQVVNPFLDLA